MAIGLVLSGGGARGAYEAGVLAELLPWLEERGERPTTFVGTSVGALGATFLASVAHLDAGEAAEALVDRWLDVTQERVIRPILTHSSPRTALRYAAELLGVPGVRLDGLLDPVPLAATADAWIDWDAVTRNIEDGTVDALAIVATSLETERATIFVQGRRPDELPTAALVDYVAARVGLDHVLASASIPVIFPAHRVESPAEVAGWYADGGTRLNTPVKPAVDLGVDRVVVAATHAPFRVREAHRDAVEPDFAIGALELVQATLIDPLIQDLRTLGKINELIPARSARAVGAATGRGYRRVPYLFAGPSRQGRLGRVVTAVHAEHFAGPVGAARAPDVAFLTRLVGGPGAAHDELLSYLLFRPEFTRALVDAGRADARALLDERDPWRIGPPAPPERG